MGAPIGSMVAGPKAFIARVHKYRKMLGGGMRQAGIIAAPGQLPLMWALQSVSVTPKCSQLLDHHAFLASTTFLQVVVQTLSIVLALCGFLFCQMR